ncbi:hypothetical protein SAMN05421819_1815 [Bryocella elongata]|uniref:Uncharacterized protein n=1 Tax=Bryocella elongata TaxID=863522 RepID=A0A1H5X156_9BACT|nr:hypothetical protein [Bryocella elongata]SEG05017.1 hypothetical protein SAMN05421819_1815 [Bryocella elongata]
MPRYSRPRSWKSHVRIWTPPVLALLCIGFFVYQEHAYKHRQLTSWTTTNATADDVRLQPVSRFALEYGSKPLYETYVLASYTVNGAPHKDWLPLSESPKADKAAHAEADAIKGKQCFVRWDPATPDQKIVELQ